MKPANSFSKKRILITGGSGYIAASLVRHLSGYPCDITLLTRKDLSRQQSVGKAIIRSLKASITDITDWEPVLSGIDVIYHLAAQTSIYQASQDPEQDLFINVVPLIRMLETCKTHHFRPVIIFASTSTIFGTPSSVPVDESARDNPLTIYDLHKKMAEEYLLFSIRQNFVSGAVLRLANVYGPGPGSSSADRGVVNQMIKRALQSQPLTLYGHGDYIRDYVFIDDVADAFLKAFACSGNLDGGPYIIGSGTGHTLREAFEEIAAITNEKTGLHAPVLSVDPPESLHPIEKRNFIADSRCFSSLTGWNPRYTLKEGLGITIDFYRKNAGES